MSVSLARLLQPETAARSATAALGSGPVVRSEAAVHSGLVERSALVERSEAAVHSALVVRSAPAEGPWRHRRLLLRRPRLRPRRRPFRRPRTRQAQRV